MFKLKVSILRKVPHLLHEISYHNYEKSVIRLATLYLKELKENKCNKNKIIDFKTTLRKRDTKCLDESNFRRVKIH